MTGITMFDTILNDQFPPGAEAYAAYVDGSIGNQPNYAYIVEAFPGAHHLSITLFGNNADVADVENGAMTPGEIPGWFARQKARGIARPVIYASASTMQNEIVPVVEALPGARAGVRLWSAHYGLGEHICGPRTCGQLSIDADGTQWTSSAMGRILDQSLLTADFFGAMPTPPSPASDWTEKIMQQLPVLALGAAGTHVRTAQFQLREKGRTEVVIDGDFGPVTAAAVTAVQADRHLAQDGTVGPVTWAVLLGVA